MAGYERARLVEPEIADNYVAHTTIGDPEADPVVDLLFSMQGTMNGTGWFRAGWTRTNK